MGKIKNIYKVLVENLKERGHYEELEVDGKIILIECGDVVWIQLVQDRDQ
jgi:hypothetical protein